MRNVVGVDFTHQKTRFISQRQRKGEKKEMKCIDSTEQMYLFFFFLSLQMIYIHHCCSECGSYYFVFDFVFKL